MWKGTLLGCAIVIVVILLLWALMQKSVETWYTPPVYRRDRRDLRDLRGDGSDSSCRSSLRILTYNIQKFPWSRKSLGALTHLAERYEVIFLQECFDDTWQALSEVLPHFYCFRGTLNRLNVMNSGLAILSRYPIVCGDFLEFAHANRWTFDIFSEKGWLSAVVDVNGEKIRLINTHLQSCDFDRFDQTALTQFDELLAYLRTVHEPFVMGGDFNVDVQDLKANYRQLDALHYPDEPSIYIHFMTSMTSALPRRGYTGMTFDYFFTTFREVKRPRVVPPRLRPHLLDYSDHQPVEIEIEIKNVALR